MPLTVLLSIPAHLGYAVLGALIGLESMGLPVPGETALVGAAVLAHQGQLSIPVVIAVAAAAAILGDNAGYLIGRQGGRRLLASTAGPFAAHRARLLDRGAHFFERHGPKAVFLARWVVGARVTAAWLAGVNRMPWPTFLAYNAAGGILWALSVGLVGFFLGAAGAAVIGAGGLIVLALILLAVGVAWVLRHRREETSRS